MFFSVLRWVSLAEAFVLVGWAVAVLQEARKFRPPNLYVRLITASYILLVATAAIHAVVGPRGPRLLDVFRFLALTYGIGAMWQMWRHYRYSERLKRHQGKTDAAAAALRRSADLD